MRIAVVGASGLIGREVVKALRARHEVLEVSHQKSAHKVNIAEVDSIRAMYKALGPLDALVSTAGAAKFLPLAQLGESDFQFSLANKLMGQVNLVRLGLETLREGGSLTITSGVLAQTPMTGSGAVSLVNAALEGFSRAAALEAPRKIRVNCVSPGWVSETLTAMGKDGSQGIPASEVAKAYVALVEGVQTGQVVTAMKAASPQR